ncbi:MAG: HAD-IA family hydrolase [Acidobacteria bacterium]|jgi:putative hydrolase of the HAD superfamily|nr:HAD-IA family hydrolase [Acidobacteriota bacterium]
MRSNGFAAVSFDAGNTLLAADPAPPVLYARVLSRLGAEVTAEEVGPVFAEVWAEAQQDARDGLDRYQAAAGGERAWWAGFVREVLERLGHDASWQDALERLYAAFTRPELWRVFPEVEGVLDRLRRRGVRLAVISNWDTRLPGILDGLGLTAHFHTIAVSSLEGVEKPSAEIFHRVAARLDIEPGRILHVGDSPREDYEGARAAGLEAVLVDRPGLFESSPFRRVSNLTEIEAMIGGPQDTGP